MKRIALYLFRDEHGIVDEYVGYCLERLRPHVERIEVVTTRPLTPEGRATLEALSDELRQLDEAAATTAAAAEARAGALRGIDRERLAQYDELLLVDDGAFGPIDPAGTFDALFARADAQGGELWTVADSGWFGVRRSLFDSPGIGAAGATDGGSLERALREARQLFGEPEHPSPAPGIADTVAQLAAGCPLLGREVFSRDPNAHASFAIIGREVIETIEQTGAYPTPLIWQHIARTVEPRVAATNFSLMRIFSDQPEAGDDELERIRGLRAAVVLHCFYEDMLDEIVDRAAQLPCSRHLVVTTDSEEKRLSIAQRLAQRGEPSFEVRVVGSNTGRDVSAFLITCADVLRDERFDLVVKLHTKRSPQDARPAADWFRRHLFENLLHSPGYASNVLRLFVRYPEIGMVMPPAVHLGYRTLGNAWYRNKGPAAALCARLGITVPLDYATPLAPLGSMFIARPAALRTLVDAGFDFADFEGDYADGSLAHVLERLFSLSSLNAGMPVYSVMHAGLASINYMFLEYKLQSFSEYLPGNAVEQKALLDRRARSLNFMGWARAVLERRAPRLAERVKAGLGSR